MNQVFNHESGHGQYNKKYCELFSIFRFYTIFRYP